MLRKATQSKYIPKNHGVTNEAIRDNPVYIAHDLLRVTADHGLAISKSHMARLRRDMGWVAKGTKYCQLFR